MSDDTTIPPLRQPGSILDPLTEIARDGARQMLAAALKAEAASFIAQFTDELLPDGRQRVVRHGTGPEREIQTGIGPVPVQRQKVRDRAKGVPDEKKIPKAWITRSISRLTAGWQEDYDRWQRRDLSARRYVYIWADGVYLQARMEPVAECMLVVLGATPEGKKELLGFQVGGFLPTKVRNAT